MKKREQVPEQLVMRSPAVTEGEKTTYVGLRTVKYTGENREGLLELLRYIWRDLDASEIEDRFQWRYERSPYQKNPCVYLALEGNRVVGFRALVVQMFKLGPGRYRVFFPSDAIVHPDHRREGIFSKLNEALLKDIHTLYPDGSLVLNLSANEYSTRGNIKQGWQAMNCLRVYSYKISPLNYLGRRSKDLSTSAGADSITVTQGRCELELTPELRPRVLAKVAAQNSDEERLGNLRDEAYFKWRYSHQTEAYSFVYCRKGGDEKGYMVLKRQSKFQYVLMEHAAAEVEMIKAMIGAAVREIGIPVIRCLALNKTERSILKKCGFITEPAWLLKFLGKQRLPPLIRPAKPVTTDRDFVVDGRDVRDIGNWRIFLADVH